MLSNDSLLVLQDIIQKCNQINNGVSWKEAIQIISDLGHAKSNEVAKKYIDYLIRNGKLNKLKKNGRVVTAQATTTERSQINIKQQLCRHYLIDNKW